MTVLLVHPLMFFLGAKIPVIRNAIVAAAPARATGKKTSRMFSAALNFRAPIVVGGSLSLLMMLFSFLPIQTKYQVHEYIDERAELILALNRIETFAGATMSIDIPLTANNDHQLLSPVYLQELGAIHEKLEATVSDAVVFSLHTLVRFLRSKGQEITQAKLEQILDQLPTHYRYRLIGRDGRTLLIGLRAPNYESSEIRVMTRQIEKVARGVDTPSLEVGNATGLLVLSSRLSDVMIRQLSISFLIAALVSPLLIGLWFRRVKFAVAALVPNILPIAAVGAVITLADWDLQFTSALALTIAFGIALDDTIHVFNRLALQQNKDGAGLERHSIVKAMAHIAPALFTTSAVLSAGLAATMFSIMPTIRYFGLLCIAVFILALLADLFLLPAIVACLKIKHPVKQK